MKEFDIEKLERKNIYRVPDDLFENIQEKVISDVNISRKTPVFKLNRAYAVAAASVLIFGTVFVYNLNHNPTKESVNSANRYALNDRAPKSESEAAYETLKADLTSLENNNQIVEDQESKNKAYLQDSRDKKEVSAETVKTVSKQAEVQMNEYLDSFSNSEITELANNSTQDVYLDLYN